MRSNSFSWDGVNSLALMYLCFIASLIIFSPLSVLTITVDHPFSDPMEPTDMSDVSDVSSTQILQFFLTTVFAFDNEIFTWSPFFRLKNAYPFSILNFSISSIVKSNSFNSFVKYR